MIDLIRKLEDYVVINDVEYKLYLSFDNVLKMFEMMGDEAIADVNKPHFALYILIKKEFTELTVEEATECYLYIFEEYIKIKQAADFIVEYDLLGNPLPKKKSDSKENDEPLYSLKYDSDYIFASFLQAYNIDLIEVQGELHWKKFNALLNGLPDSTKFVEVVRIRSWQPSKGDSTEYKNQMLKLQEQYRLPAE